jgi:heat shock protein HslJ
VYPGDPAGLVSTAWRLASLDGQALIAGSALTMAFHDGHLVSGHAGCRDYLATYQAAGGDLAFTYSAMLGPVCAEDALLEQEGAYTTALGWTAHYRLAQDKLELFTVRGETLTFAPLPTEAQSTLEGPTWSLLAFIEPNPYDGSPYPPPLPGDVLAGTEITAKFADGTMRGSTGCNSYNGAYNQEGDSFAIGPTAVTEMACLEPAGAMEQEGRFLDLLASVTVHHVYGDQLWLEADDGRALVFRARLPEGGSTPCTEPAPTLAGLIL